MSTIINYNVVDSWYRRNNGTWWAPLRGGRLASNWVLDGSQKYETKLKFDKDKIVAKNATSYIVSAYLYVHKSDPYHEPNSPGLAKVTNSDYDTLEGGADGVLGSAWASYNITGIIDSYIGASGAFIGTYGDVKGSYLEYHTDGSSYPAYLKITWENRSVDAPTSTSASPETFLSGNVTVSWSGASADHMTITGYDIVYATKLPGQSWTAWSNPIHVTTSATSGSYNHDWNPQAGGQQIKYKVRTVAGSISSGYGPESGIIVYNSVPGAPTVQFPVANKTTYNKTPIISFKFGADHDNQKQIGTASIGAVTTVSNGTNSSFWSQTGTFDGGTRLLVTFSTLTAGSKSLVCSQNDGIEDSQSTTIPFVISDLTLTNSDSLVVEGVHITELRTAINNVRAYYGLAPYVWSNLDVVRRSHITELRSAIEGIAAFLNAIKAGTVTISWGTLGLLSIDDVTEIRDIIITL